MKKLKLSVLVFAAALVAVSAFGMGMEIDPNGLAQHGGLEIDPNGLAQSAGLEIEPNGLAQHGGLDIEPNGLAR